MKGIKLLSKGLHTTEDPWRVSISYSKTCWCKTSIPSATCSMCLVKATRSSRAIVIANFPQTSAKLNSFSEPHDGRMNSAEHYHRADLAFALALLLGEVKRAKLPKIPPSIQSKTLSYQSFLTNYAFRPDPDWGWVFPTKVHDLPMKAPLHTEIEHCPILPLP